MAAAAAVSSTPLTSKVTGIQNNSGKGLFINGDPESLFTELSEIGHGNFGAVYYAKYKTTGEVVAIKKMSFQGKNRDEKQEDIRKEVVFIQKLRHENCVTYKGAYLHQSTAWLIMEYCLGSAADILEVLKSPLREPEIACVISGSLRGLAFLHSKQYIHRDVKAGNILLTDSGIIKLGDFGSASMQSPANSFIGTPHWMSPELITAMEDGVYDGRTDIWSLGITTIELAEKKPPLFHMNAMSALYHIPQDPPPRLQNIDIWSRDLHDFVSQCLQSAPVDRLTADMALQHNFISKLQPSNTILDLIARSTRAVVQSNTMQQYRRGQNMLRHAEASSSSIDTESQDTVSVDKDSDSLRSEDPDDLNSDAHSHAESEENNGSVPRFNIGGPPSLVPSPHLGLHSSQNLANAASSGIPAGGSPILSPMNLHFPTIKSAHVVNKERRQHMQDQSYRDQMANYKEIRRKHQKSLKQREMQHRNEENQLKLQLDKEYFSQRDQCAKQLDKLRDKGNQERDKLMRDLQLEEDKFRRHLEAEAKAKIKLFRKEDRNSTASSSSSKSSRGSMVESYSREQTLFVESSIRAIRKRALQTVHVHSKEALERELNLREQQLDQSNSMLLDHHERLREQEESHTTSLHQLRLDQLKEQHKVEKSNQVEIFKRQLDDMVKKHKSDTRQLPRNLKSRIQRVRRQFNETCKIQEKQFKYLEQQVTMSGKSRDEQRSELKRIKDDKAAKLMALTDQYENSMMELKRNLTDSTKQTQDAEHTECIRRQEEEKELLASYQSRVQASLLQTHQKECQFVQEKIRARRDVLDRSIDESNSEFKEMRNKRRQDLENQQRQKMSDFDSETERLHEANLLDKNLVCKELAGGITLPIRRPHAERTVTSGLFRRSRILEFPGT